jgi:hypothetical protein
MIRGWQSVVFLERNDRTLSGVLFTYQMSLQS